MLALLMILQVQMSGAFGYNTRQFVMDTLVAMTESAGPGEVFIGSVYNARGLYTRSRDGKPWRVTVVNVGDMFALVHEFGHHFSAYDPMLYFEWEDSMGLDPRRFKDNTEKFADDFAGAVMILRSGQPFGGEKKKRSQEFIARRLRRRRPWRRRKGDDDNSWDELLPPTGW